MLFLLHTVFVSNLLILFFEKCFFVSSPECPDPLVAHRALERNAYCVEAAVDWILQTQSSESGELGEFCVNLVASK